MTYNEQACRAGDVVRQWGAQQWGGRRDERQTHAVFESSIVWGRGGAYATQGIVWLSQRAVPGSQAMRTRALASMQRS